MAKQSSVNQRAKGVERAVQQYLFPGTTFPGGAKRPALEEEDIRGFDALDYEWWGEVKNYSTETIKQKGGVWRVLETAFGQAKAAILKLQPEDDIRPFSVLWIKGSKKDDQRLVMVDQGGLRVIIKLCDFKDVYIGREKDDATALGDSAPGA